MMPVRYGSDPDTKRIWSPNLWGDCPFWALQSGGMKGVSFFDDFLNFTPSNIAAATGGATVDTEARAAVNAILKLISGYATHHDVGGSITQIATEQGGVIRLSTSATDNDEVYMQMGGNTGTCALFGSGTGKMWFETRFRVNAVSDSAIIIALAEEGLAAANTLTDDSGAIADKDYVGFRALTADSDGLDAVYNTAGGGGETVHLNEAQVMVADTWYKAGLYSDGATTKFYINGTPGLTAAYGATNFPDGQELAPLVGVKTGSAADIQLDFDWIRFAQLYSA